MVCVTAQRIGIAHQMNITQAITQRHSVRAFTQQAVSQQQIEQLLTTASHSPSGANTQPWQVAVVTGKTKRDLQDRLQHAFKTGLTQQPDYQYYPTDWQSPYLTRRRECGLQLYRSLNISKADTERRQAQWAANYRAFDAPVMLLFFMDAVMQTGSYLDYGMFLQSVMLAAMEQGLASCPQAALAEYPELIRQTLGYPDDKIVICGLALGYEDTTAPVNDYRTPREPATEFTDYFD
jgi:nitroreductase